MGHLGRTQKSQAPSDKKLKAYACKLEQKLEARTREVAEALEQQTATAEVLRVISSSPGKLEPVFETILANATRLCEAKFGTLYLYGEDAFRAVAFHNTPPAYLEYLKRGPIRPSPGIALGRLRGTKQLVHIADITAEPAYAQRDPVRVAIAELAGARTVIAVPMLKEGELIGAIGIYRQEVRPFTDKQIELVQNFAAQAVIAIENARLLDELRQRTDDLSESLEQQTATSEVLSVISSSQGELVPVFQAMLENATRICEAKFGTLYLREGDGLRAVALHGAPLPFAEERQRRPVIYPGRTTLLGRTVATKRTGQIADVQDEADYAAATGSTGAQLAKLGGARSVVTVPMMRGEGAIGTVNVVRRRPGPLSDKQRELLRIFANQAVIAIENTRLFNELRQSLEQQTATSEVLRVVSSSPGELEPVFRAMLENTVRICGAKFGTLYLREADAFRAVATHNAPTPYVEDRKRNLWRPPPDSTLGQVLKTHRVTQVADITAVKSYIEGDPYLASAVKLGGYRTVLAVPMLKDDSLIGAITINRQEVQRLW